MAIEKEKKTWKNKNPNKNWYPCTENPKPRPPPPGHVTKDVWFEALSNVELCLLKGKKYYNTKVQHVWTLCKINYIAHNEINLNISSMIEFGLNSQFCDLLKAENYSAKDQSYTIFFSDIPEDRIIPSILPIRFTRHLTGQFHTLKSQYHTEFKAWRCFVKYGKDINNLAYCRYEHLCNTIKIGHIANFMHEAYFSSSSYSSCCCPEEEEEEVIDDVDEMNGWSLFRTPLPLPSPNEICR